MALLLVMLVVALAASSIGFKKYVWFISIGYGLAIAAIGVALLIAGRDQLTAGTICACALLIAYGVRLGGFLALRELRSASYNAKMEGEIKSGDDVSMPVKCAIWGSAALLYACQTAPVALRFVNHSGTDALLVIGLAMSALGLVVESAADVQKNAAKRVRPGRFVDTGLFSIVRCPNYFGELLFWTGVFVGGIPAYAGVLQWAVALLGFVGIVYVMFSGARRLEIRQNKSYGDDPEYQRFVATTPILIPGVPIYSVERHTWLVA